MGPRYENIRNRLLPCAGQSPPLAHCSLPCDLVKQLPGSHTASGMWISSADLFSRAGSIQTASPDSEAGLRATPHGAVPQELCPGQMTKAGPRCREKPSSAGETQSQLEDQAESGLAWGAGHRAGQSVPPAPSAVRGPPPCEPSPASVLGDPCRPDLGSCGPQLPTGGVMLTQLPFKLPEDLDSWPLLAM